MINAISRIKFSDKMYGVLFSLIKRENDFGSKKKKHAAKWYKDKVANILELKEQANPSLRSYEEQIKKIKKTLLPENPLYRPWSIGSCTDSNYVRFFPPESIPILTEFKKTLDDRQYGLLLRDAKWIIRLKPLIEKIYPPDKVMEYTATAAECYADAEELSLSRGDSYFDSSEYDLILAKGDFEKYYKKHLNSYFGGKEL